LSRGGGASREPDDARLARLFEQHLGDTRTWVDRQPYMGILPCGYSRLVEEPGVHAEAVARFIGADLDVRQMADVVDRSLYRQRI